MKFFFPRQKERIHKEYILTELNIKLKITLKYNIFRFKRSKTSIENFANTIRGFKPPTYLPFDRIYTPKTRKRSMHSVRTKPRLATAYLLGAPRTLEKKTFHYIFHPKMEKNKNFFGLKFWIFLTKASSLTSKEWKNLKSRLACSSVLCLAARKNLKRLFIADEKSFSASNLRTLSKWRRLTMRNPSEIQAKAKCERPSCPKLLKILIQWRMKILKIDSKYF